MRNFRAILRLKTLCRRSTTPKLHSCSYETDEHGLAHWTEAHADAWIGLLETHKQLTRALDAELTAQHGLSLSGLELLARLAAADDRQMHLTALAGASGLSLSRVSRIIGVLEERKLVDRHACPSDARAVHAQLNDAGLDARARGPVDALRLRAGGVLRSARRGRDRDARARVRPLRAALGGCVRRRRAAMSPRDPEELEATAAPAYGEISPLATMGAVHLTVSDLERSLDYYRSAVGLGVLENGAGRASLGVGARELLVLVEEPGARRPPATRGSTTSRCSSSSAPTSRAGWRTPRATAWRSPASSDHFVSEALYLDDPDGHGIEIYWDRPREVWEGQVATRLTTQPLDVESLLGELADPRTRALRRAHGRDGDGPRAPEGRRGRADRRLLPRRPRVRA